MQGKANHNYTFRVQYFLTSAMSFAMIRGKRKGSMTVLVRWKCQETGDIANWKIPADW